MGYLSATNSYGCTTLCSGSSKDRGNREEKGDLMRTRSVLTLLGLTAAGMLTPVAAGAAAPVAAHCGAMLSTDAFLAADLSCPAGNGLTLTGSVTLDLRSHRLIGPGSSGTGITVQSESSPRIQNGSINGWAAGVTNTPIELEQRAFGTATLNAVTFTGNTAGISAYGALPDQGPNYLVRNSRFERNRSGLAGLFTGLITVSGSSFHKNGTGLHVDTGSMSISKSRFDANGTGVDCYEAYCTLQASSLANNQTAVAATTFGITATGNVIRGNTIGLGVSTGLVSNVSHNTFAGNKTGVSFYAAGGTVARNSFTGNEVGFTSSSAGDPFTAELDRNVFTGNGDGIYITDQGISLKRNIAAHNSRWGIYAPQSTDLGGNKAFGNGHTPQCVGVIC